MTLRVSKNQGSHTWYTAEHERKLRRHVGTIADLTSGVIHFDHDAFTVTNVLTTTYQTTKTPIAGSLLLAQNGLVLREGTDYSVTYGNGVITVAASLTVGDVLVARYATLGANSPTASITDTFNRANNATSLGTTSDGTTVWTSVAGTWGITSNQAYMPTPPGDFYGVATVAGISADGTLALDLVSYTSSGCGLALRVVDSSNFIYASASALVRRQSGSTTILSNYGGAAVTPGHRIQVTLSGSSITVEDATSSTSLASVTETFNQSITDHGLFCDDSGSRLDNFDFLPA